MALAARACSVIIITGAMARKHTMTAMLKKAISESGMAHIAIERATGVKRASIMRFMRGETSLRLDLADRLAAYFGLEVRPGRKGR
jgi:plasmid maintenance system antidote protein VapI